MGRGCSTNGAKRNAYWWENQKETDNWEGQDIGGWITLKWILEREDGLAWTGLIWLRIGTTGGLL
jgi:hypothetical protein